MDIRKILQELGFNFIVLSLVEKGDLLFLLIMLDYVKSTLWNKQQLVSDADHFSPIQDGRGKVPSLSIFPL